MGYWGTIVLARADGSITGHGALSAFGERREWLRDLGGGWQLLETRRHVDDPPDLAEATSLWTRSVGTPVLAAYVNDGDCTGVFAAAPGAPGWSAHLPDPTADCQRRHRPSFSGRGIPTSRAVELAESWARHAGLAPAHDYLTWIMGSDPEADGPEDTFIFADDLVFELVLAVGVPAITESGPPRLDPESDPFRLICGEIGGLAVAAHFRVADRKRALEHGADPDPLPDWVADVIQLDDRIWAARWGGDADIQALGEQARRLAADFHADGANAGPATPIAEQITELMLGKVVRIGDLTSVVDAAGNLNPPGLILPDPPDDERPERHPLWRRPS